MSLNIQIHRNLKPLFISDFLRVNHIEYNPYKSFQNNIAEVVGTWFRPVLEEVFSGPMQTGLWSEDATDLGERSISMPVRQIYEMYGCTVSFSGWVKLYKEEACQELLEVLAPITSDRLIVGFEIPPILVDALNKLAVPYVSFAIHPLRFMPDYLFSLQSNAIKAEDISEFAVPRENLEFGAQLRTARTQKDPLLPFNQNSAALFGQVSNDAALIGANGQIRLQDFEQEIDQLCRSHQTVYFKPHPYAQDARQQIEFLAKFGNIVAINVDAYKLMSSPNINAVAAQTSSILSEAPYFRKKPIPFGAHWQDQSAEPAYDIGSLSRAFWEQLLHPSRDTSTSNTTPLPKALRNEFSIKKLLGISWSDRGLLEGVNPLAPELSFNTEVVFGNSKQARQMRLGDAWYPGLADHCWTDAGDCRLHLKFPSGVSADCEIELTVMAMATPESPVICDFVIHDEVAPSIMRREKFENLETRSIRIPVLAHQIPALGDLVMELDISGGNSPNSIDPNNHDRRRLALMVQTIRLLPAKCGEPVHQNKTIEAKYLSPASPLLVNGWNFDGGTLTFTEQASLAFYYQKTPDTDQTLVIELDTKAAISASQSALVRIATSEAELATQRVICSGQSASKLNIPLKRGWLQNQTVISVTIEPEGATFHARAISFRSVLDSNYPEKTPAIANVLGPHRIETGLAVMTRNVCSALGKAHAASSKVEDYAPPSLLNLNNSEHLENAKYPSPGASKTSDVSIFCGDVRRISRLIETGGTGFLKDRYNICYGAWELENLPEYLADTRDIQEYWGLSQFIADAARKKMNIPVKAMPIPVSIHYPSKLVPREYFGIPDRTFSFLFTFSVDSTLTRKNPHAVYSSFRKAFEDNDKSVSLIFKCMKRPGQHIFQREYDEFLAEIAADSRVVLLDGIYNKDDLANLYLACDAFVSLHRAEGFGLTMAEAMGYGKPTIGTGYSGNLDFMSPQNACLVDYELLEMTGNEYHHQKQRWAEPNIEHAAHFMRKLKDDGVFRERVARAGKQTIVAEFSNFATGKRMLNRIQEIRQQFP
ncbi:glycosyl transferase family 1 [Roseibium hamelinense]|uniref:Glycosyl transferase family 1 n=1 Tax=Roseibium hamelinense TaxID=150831 RepID=A0A562SXI5_9HYPH|nr:glycosyltransferase [Roseibium hamelinense]MTI44789.1 glycosyltransferase [Roseibium hamelinense]TWI86019.1 glycosyl transferase family 1 [Roseibium hamelinense]